MFSPQRVVALISGIPWTSGEQVRVFWLQISGTSRTAFAKALEEEEGGEPIVPLVLREPLFNLANVVMSDLARLIQANRAAFARVSLKPISRITIVILANDEFRLPQISSPTILPDWFPFKGGYETYIRISEFATKAEVGLLNCEEARLEDLSQSLFELEQAMVRRLNRINQTQPKILENMWVSILDSKDAKTDRGRLIQDFQRHLDRITNPQAYRPSIKTGTCLISCLIKAILRSSPDELGTIASSVARGLGSADAEFRAPMFAVMLRPINLRDVSAKTYHAILLTVYQAYQFLTGAAHASEYPEFPIALVYATSLDLRRGLKEALIYVEALPE